MAATESALTYVVTGAASGIGAATAALLRERGHRVISVDLRDADVIADLATASGRKAAVREVKKLGNRIDGICAAAGVAGLTGVDPQLVVSVNYFGAVEFITGLRPELARAKQSSVVVLASNSITCQPGWAGDVAKACLTDDEDKARRSAAHLEPLLVYPATKAALAYWARREGVTKEWIGKGIRINAVAPGLIATAMTDTLRQDALLGRFADSYPTALKRPGRPEEVAALIAFLLSQESSLMVGTVSFADGGSDAIVNPTEPAGKAANAMVAGAMSAAMKLAGKAAPLLDKVPDSVKERVKDAQTSLRQSK